MAGIWIITEKKEQALELLSIGRCLGNKMNVSVAVLAIRDIESRRDYAAHGAHEVMLAKPLAADQSVDALLPVIADEVKKHKPDAILFPATFRCRDMAARLAVRLKTGLVSNCIGLAYDDSIHSIIMSRLAYGGAAIQKVISLTGPVIATIMPGTFVACKPDSSTEAAHRDLPASPSSALKICELKERLHTTKDITEARVVVAAGRGFEKKEDISLARQLADKLGGEVGCTRPISEENHWLPEELCIGLSGVQVKPDFYLGLGISGQVQHVTGIRSARVIAAINKDENAPIFSVADLGIVGNIYDVVPRLLQALARE